MGVHWTFSDQDMTRYDSPKAAAPFHNPPPIYSLKIWNENRYFSLQSSLMVILSNTKSLINKALKQFPSLTNCKRKTNVGKQT